jgi:hypothetical protein
VEVRERIEPEEIWLNFPDLPTLKELDLAYIARSNGHIVHAQEIIPTRGWLGAYETYKSKGHIFAPREYVREVYQAARDVLKEVCGLEFNDAVVAALNHWS